MLRECVNCKTVYNYPRFGAGTKYCSKACRFGAGSLEALRTGRGRPRRFPVAPDNEEATKLRAWLAKYNWLTVQALDSLGRAVPNLYIAKYKHFLVRVCFGGNAHHTRRAHACVFYSKAGYPVVASTCYERRELDVSAPVGTGRTGTHKRLPCGDTLNCARCRPASWIVTTIEVAQSRKPSDNTKPEPLDIYVQEG